MPNGDQLLGLTGQPDHFSAIKEVLNLGAGGVAVTLGADGCLVAARDSDPVHLPALPAKVVGALVATGLGSDAGITDLEQVLDFARQETAR
jgi:sugar/nucleoside kinase (ribokinase family)